MGVKTYQAYTMAEALAAAKRDLGSDAVILETRTFRRGGMLGVGRRTIFELTATSNDRVDLSRTRRPVPQPVADRAVREYKRRAPATSDFTRTRRLAQAMAETQRREPKEPPMVTVPAKRTPGSLTPVAKRFILTPTGAGAGAPAGAPATTPAAIPATTSAFGGGTATATAVLDPPAPGAVMQQELSAIKTMVGQVLSRQGTLPDGRRPDVPGRLFDMYLELIGQDLSRELADRIITSVRDDVPVQRWDDTEALREAVLVRLSELVPVADAPTFRPSPDQRPLTIALIGPTGVGKTTTLAKLAASFKLRQGRRVGLVTCDTYRIAAVDQLRTYANIIGLPLEIALTAPDMRRAVHGMSDCDVVLIDTAGRGPDDRGRLVELKQCLEAVDPHEVHLVLSSTASERVLLREAEAFADVGADRIVLTKLDEAVSFGVLINVMQAVGKSLSFITTGQEVPDHIEAGRPRRLAELVLGAELRA